MLIQAVHLINECTWQVASRIHVQVLPHAPLEIVYGYRGGGGGEQALDQVLCDATPHMCIVAPAPRGVVVLRGVGCVVGGG